MKEEIEFISTDPPVTFYLNVKKKGTITRELYQAEVIKGSRSPLNPGYYIVCIQL